MDSFGIKRRDVRSFEIWLDISMQLDLEKYPTVDVNDKSTWETEHREYIVTDEELVEWIEQAKAKTNEYRRSVEADMVLERLGVTYSDIYKIFTRKEADPGFENDDKYEADEDLYFCYERLSELYHFLCEAKYEISKRDYSDQQWLDNLSDEIDRAKSLQEVEDSLRPDDDVEVKFDSDGEPPF